MNTMSNTLLSLQAKAEDLGLRKGLRCAACKRELNGYAWSAEFVLHSEGGPSIYGLLLHCADCDPLQLIRRVAESLRLEGASSELTKEWNMVQGATGASG